MNDIFHVADLLRKIRSELRFGEWSRGALQLMRIEVRKQEAWCDWLARPADEWDAYIPPYASARNFTLQALEDAINVRAMLFSVLGGVQTAELRAFRALPGGCNELVLSGTTFRDDKLPARGTALAMRAKLLGFHFTVADGSLIRLADHTNFSPNASFCPSYPNHLKEVS